MRESKVLSKNITKRFSQGSYSDLSILNSHFEVSFSQKRVGGGGGGVMLKPNTVCGMV